MSLLANYISQIKAKNLTQDLDQLAAIEKLDKLSIAIERQQKFLKLKNILHKFFNHKLSGIYLYSNVGRGKTMMMDMFYNNLNVKSGYKYRVHFHLFMRNIHNNLQLISGQSNPIDYFIKTNFKNYQIICLDEFIVNDIADAMILTRVLNALVKYRIILVTTSNLQPDDLYKNGLQRELFLPAIDLIKNNLDVINLAGNIDYRAQMLQQMSCYFYPNNPDNLILIKNLFIKLAFNNYKANNKITILDRDINYIYNSANIIWFDFDVICNSARSQNDYLELASLYQSIIISNIYELIDDRPDIIKRFINLIDILYDNKVNLIICAERELEQLYIGLLLKFEFARTLSRIKEMQTVKYLESGHLS